MKANPASRTSRVCDGECSRIEALKPGAFYDALEHERRRRRGTEFIPANPGPPASLSPPDVPSPSFSQSGAASATLLLVDRIARQLDVFWHTTGQAHGSARGFRIRLVTGELVEIWLDALKNGLKIKIDATPVISAALAPHAAILARRLRGRGVPVVSVRIGTVSSMTGQEHAPRVMP